VRRIIRERLARPVTYANVMSTIAVFVALGGTSYAVTQLPRDSVGSAQIKRDAVRSPEIDNGSLRLGDFGASTREALRGQKGDAGPPGASAAKFFAAVTAAGATSRGNATAASHTSVGSGSYTISFAQNVSACVYTATLGTTDGTTAPAGRISVRDDGGSVGVQTYDAAGNPADLPFHLTVVC
jgi:hypothetical protein